MHPVSQRKIQAGRIVLTAAVGVLLLAPLLPPFLPFGMAEAIRMAYANVCHQLPERLFHFHGESFAVCQRCLGIYLGLFVALVSVPAIGLRRSRRYRGLDRGLLVLSMAVLMLDWGLTLMGWFAGSPVSRLSTGLFFGAVAGVFLSEAIFELVSGTGRKPTPVASRAAARKLGSELHIEDSN